MFVRTAHADYIYDYDWAPHLSIIVVANAKFGGGDRGGGGVYSMQIAICELTAPSHPGTRQQQEKNPPTQKVISCRPWMFYIIQHSLRAHTSYSLHAAHIRTARIFACMCALRSKGGLGPYWHKKS